MGDEFVSPLGAHGGRFGEPGGLGSIEKVTQTLGIRERSVSPPNPDCIGADDDRYRMSVAGDGHFLAGEHTVEDLR